MNNNKLMTEISMSSKPQFWAGGVAEKTVLEAEARLKLSFPADYIEFLKTFGAGSLGSLEIYGLGCPATGVPNVEFVIKALDESGTTLPDGLIPVALEDNGGYACLVCKKSSIGPLGCVVDFSGESLEVIGSSFTEYLENRL